MWCATRSCRISLHRLTCLFLLVFASSPPPPHSPPPPSVPRWLLTLVAVHRAELFRAQEQCFSESSGLLIVVKMLLYVRRNRRFIGDRSPGRPLIMLHSPHQNDQICIQTGSDESQLDLSSFAGGHRDKALSVTARHIK